VVAPAKSIGDILVAGGQMQPQDLERVLELQRQEHIPFGEAAISLGLLSKSDIEFALSKQFDYAYLPAEDSSVSPQLIAAYRPFSPVGENLRAVRAQLMLRWFNGDASRKMLAVVSPSKGDGRSFVAANLAIVFAQQGQRTLLIDADLRSSLLSSQQALFQMPRAAGLSTILAGRGGLELGKLVRGLPNLGVLAAGAIPPNPQELLGRPHFEKMLKRACDLFDVILIDTPSGSDYADAEIIAARAGAALMVARRNQSLVPQAVDLSKRLQDGGVTMVGSVLNDA
jgi:receptor protein-tyrosine kinase